MQVSVKERECFTHMSETGKETMRGPQAVICVRVSRAEERLSLLQSFAELVKLDPVYMLWQWERHCSIAEVQTSVCV